jgi:hypothetical protein
MTLGRPILLSTVCAVLLAMAPTASAAPTNDDFADAAPLRVGQTVAGSIDGATGQRSEPRHAATRANRSVWYKLSARRRTTVLLSVCKTNFDTVVAVYTGRSMRRLRVIEFNNNGCYSNSGSRVTFTARPGRTYRIAVAGSAAGGAFRLSASRLRVPPNDDFGDAVATTLGEAISGTTRNATRELGEPGHHGSRSVWFRLRVTEPIAVEVLTYPSPHGDGPGTCGANATVYTGRSVDALTRVRPIDQGSCFVRFEAQPGVTYRVVVASPGSGGSYRFSTSLYPD